MISQVNNKLIVKMFLLKTFLVFSLSANDYMDNCTVPNVLLKTVQITENKTSNPYLIRTNQDINSFYSIVDRFSHKRTKDKNVIDCINKENCTYITNSLIENNIIDIDLGLHQINYKSYQYEINSYFDKFESYINACTVIENKIGKNKNNWSWKKLAEYHSKTPALNEKYKQKLIDNYLKLTQ